METLAQLMVASTDLVEAEARMLKRQAVRFLLAAGMGVVAIALILVGLGFLLFGGFAFLARFITVPGAAGVFGVVAIALAVAALAWARKTIHRPA